MYIATRTSECIVRETVFVYRCILKSNSSDIFNVVSISLKDFFV